MFKDIGAIQRNGVDIGAIEREDSAAPAAVFFIGGLAMMGVGY